MQRRNYKKDTKILFYLGATVALAVTLFAMLLSCGGDSEVTTGVTTVSVSDIQPTEPATSETVSETTAETTLETTPEATVSETIVPTVIGDDDFLLYAEGSPEYEIFDLLKNRVPSVEEEIVETSADETGNVTEITYTEWRDGNAALYYNDIENGKTLIVNGDKRFSAASMIKAVYIYTLLVSADEGALDLDEELVYTSDKFVKGTGVFKDFEDGSTFTVRQLISYTMRHSDNTAYSMLRKRFGTEFFTPAMEKAGISASNYNKWWTATVTQYGEFFTVLAKYLTSESENAKWLKDEMINSNQRVMLQNALSPDVVAHKYGWDDDSYCDGGVAFSENGVYAVVFMSDLDGGSYYGANTRFIYALGDLILEMRAADYPSESEETTALSTAE